MKKKILSVLLLVAMLITAVPVMISAEESASNGTGSQSVVGVVDYNDLYVQDGLTALYTTFGDYASTADLTTGKWTDLVSGKTATMGDYGHWRVGELGGVGFNTFRGNMEDTDEDGYKETFNKDLLTGQNYNNTNLKLDFGIAQLPTGDFTVEYLAMYKPVYVYDASEADHIARDKSGNKIEVFQFDNQANGLAVNKSLTSITAGDVDQFGWFTSYSSAIDSVATWGDYTDAQRAARRGIIFWVFDNVSWYAGHNGQSIGDNYWNETIMDKASNVFQQNNAVNTYSVSLDETLTVAGDGTRTTTGLFSLYRNGAYFASNASSLNTTANNGTGAKPEYLNDGGYYDIDTAWTGSQMFRLSVRRPTDFFAVRIYDRVLSDAEKLQNRGVDILQWYGVEISEADAADEVRMQGIYLALADVTLETDASAMAATKAEVEAIIAGATLTDAKETLYVQKGLTSLFTAFAGESNSLKNTNGVTWMNRVAGKDNATFVGTAWTAGALGGIGRDVIYGTLNTAEDGTYSFAAHNDRNTYWATNNHKLQLGLDLLPKDDYTVEYLAFYPPQYSVNAKTGELIATDEAAVLTNGDTTTNTYYPYQLTWVDRFGFLTFITDNPHGRIEKQPIGAIRPRAEDSGCKDWGGTYGTNYGWGDLNFTVDTRNVKRIATYALTRDEETTLNGEGVATKQTAVYSQLFDGTVLASKTFTTANGKIAEGGSNVGSQYFFGEDDTDFYLSYRVGAHYYALRIYDRVLDADERAQNHAADVYYYYGLSLSDEALADEEIVAKLAELAVGVTFERDASAYAAMKAMLQTAVEDAVASTQRAQELRAMYAAPESLVGLFSIYAEGSLNTATGAWTNLAGEGTATFDSPARWSVNADGSFGYTAWIGSIADDGTTNNVYAGNDTAHLGFDGTNHGRQRGAKLSLGLALLPEGDMTVEFMAMSKPVYVADAEESSASGVVYAKDENGDYYSAYGVFGASYFNVMDYGTPSNITIDQVGYYGTISPVTDGAYWGGGRGAVHWFLETSWASDRTGIGSGGAWGGNWGLNVNGNPYWTVNVIRTYGIYIDETVTDTATEAVFGLYRNATYYNSNADKVSTTADGTYYAGGYSANASKAGFYLCSARPTDFYGVRVYDKVLSEAEQQRNHLIDLSLYYDIALSDAVFADDALMSQLAAACVGVAFATDASAYAATRAELAAGLVTLGGSTVAEEMLSLYAQAEHLTGLFTVYEPYSINLTAGKWTDLVDGDQATFGKRDDASNWWEIRADGSVGYDVFYGQIQADGTYNGGNELSTNRYKSQDGNFNKTRLDFGTAMLPTESFTVEYTALYNPIYVATHEGEIAKNEDGTLMEYYEKTGNGAPSSQYSLGLDHIGFIYSTTTNRDGTYSSFLPNRGDVLWAIRSGTVGAGGGWGDAWVGSSAWGSGGMRGGFHKKDAVYTYGISLTETTTAEATTAVYQLYHNSNTFKTSPTLSTANTATGTVYYAENNYGYFYLSCMLPTDFYTVRIYDTVLSADDKLQNTFVDMLYYYGVDIPEALKGETEIILSLASELVSLGMVKDASAKAANKATIEAAIADATKTVTIKLGTTVLESFDILGDTLTLPSFVDGKAAIGWRVNGASVSVAPGTVVSVTEDMTATPVLFGLPETSAKQSVKFTDKAEEMGMRFTAEFSRLDYTNLVKLYGFESIRFGMLITPDAYVQMAGAFTREALRAMVDERAGVESAAYIQIVSDKFYAVDESVLTLAGTVYSFKETTYAKNPAFAAIAFIDVDTNDDGVYDMTIYGGYDAATSTRVTDAMTTARENATNTQKGWIDSLMSRFGA